MKPALSLLLAFLLLPLHAAADEQPSVSPTMRCTGDKLIDESVTEYDGNAPMYARFEANPENVGDYEARYEWRFNRQNEEEPFLVRYDERTDYNFTQSGSYYVELRVSFILEGDTIEYVMIQPFSISIAESYLEVPNTFTPNGDWKNDKFMVKQDSHRSIVEFRAMVFNRWGKKLYEWTDITDGWDGRSGGRDCPEGAYYVHIEAKGADGRKYNIRKTINLLRGYLDGEGAIN